MLLATKMFNRALIAYPELHGSLAEAKLAIYPSYTFALNTHVQSIFSLFRKLIKIAKTYLENYS